ncbi:hypothetical protein FOC4_g10000253, partial [Fusarium odoratissimum]
IQLCKELDILICLLCPVAIKPGIDQVKHHYRNRHKAAGRQLQEVVAFAAYCTNYPAYQVLIQDLMARALWYWVLGGQ